MILCNSAHFAAQIQTAMLSGESLPIQNSRSSCVGKHYASYHRHGEVYLRSSSAEMLGYYLGPPQ